MNLKDWWRFSKFARWLNFSCWVGGLTYLVLLVSAYACLWWFGERHWSGTLLEFGPRWILLTPVVVLALGALYQNWRLWGIVTAALVLGVWFTGMCWTGLLPRQQLSGSEAIRVLTLNTDGRADPQQVAVVVAESTPQIVVLQECQHDIWQKQFSGWNVEQLGEFVVASRLEITPLEPFMVEVAPETRLTAVSCRASLPAGEITIVNIHISTPRDGLDAMLSQGWGGIPLLETQRILRRSESQEIETHFTQIDGHVILAGDFNQSADTWAWYDCWGKYQNAFTVAGMGWGTTFHTRHHGVRIDHVLASEDLKVSSCWVANAVGSSHRPVIATLVLPSTP